MLMLKGRHAGGEACTVSGMPLCKSAHQHLQSSGTRAEGCSLSACLEVAKEQPAWLLSAHRESL